MVCTLDDIVAALGGTLRGEGSIIVEAVAPLSQAQAGQLSFLSSGKYASQLASTGASCVIVTPAVGAGLAHWLDSGRAWIEVESPYLYFARLTQWWKRCHHGAAKAGIHPSAVVHPTAVVHETATIGPLCVVGANVVIGAHTVLASRVSVYDDCSIGQRCLIHSGAVIGADGFGFAQRPDQSWEKIEQLGGVRIGDDVEVGANTCIDRGALGDTVIGDGVKLDNLVQIGHNVQIGAHSALAGNAGVAGSAVIGRHCTVGGGAGILGHLSLGDNVHISAMSTVTRSIFEPGLHTGIFPLAENAAWEKNAATLRQLHQLRDRIRSLEKKQAG